MKTTVEIAEAEKKNPARMDSLREELALAQTIRELIEKKGLTQREVARRMGTSSAHLHRILNFEVSPTILTLRKLAKALDCKLEIGIIS